MHNAYVILFPTEGHIVLLAMHLRRMKAILDTPEGYDDNIDKKEYLVQWAEELVREVWMGPDVDRIVEGDDNANNNDHDIHDEAAEAIQKICGICHEGMKYFKMMVDVIEHNFFIRCNTIKKKVIILKVHSW